MLWSAKWIIKGDTFALECICLVLIQDWLKYAHNRYYLFIYQTGEGVPPTTLLSSLFSLLFEVVRPRQIPICCSTKTHKICCELRSEWNRHTRKVFLCFQNCTKQLLYFWCSYQYEKYIFYYIIIVYKNILFYFYTFSFRFLNRFFLPECALGQERNESEKHNLFTYLLCFLLVIILQVRLPQRVTAVAGTWNRALMQNSLLGLDTLYP